MTTDNENFKAQIDRLPLMDESALAIISLLEDSESSFESIVEKLSPEVTAKFLSMANSASYGVKVMSISHAVRVLGFSAMKQGLISSMIINHFDVNYSDDFKLEKFHRQAQFCVAISRGLGEILEYERQADLFTVAILHNIGKLIIAVYFGFQHKEIVGLKNNEDLSTCEAELRILGFTHAEISAIALERFHIPHELCSAIRFHDCHTDELPEIADNRLTYILRESARLADKFQLPEQIEPLAIVDKMRDTINTGRELCRNMQREEIKSQGYHEFFPKLLKVASSLIEEPLNKNFVERAF